MLPLFVFILLIAGAFSNDIAVADYEFSENMAEALQRGNHLFKSQNIEEALIEFENVVLMEPTNVKGLTGMMQCYLRLGDLSKARNMLDQIVRYSTNASLIDTLTKHMDEAERLSDQMAARDFFSQQMSDFENATDPKPPPVTNTPVVSPASAMESSSPRGKFAKAIQLQKRGFTSQAIPLFMDAIMEDANLLYANDHKLLESSRSYYLNQTRTNPKDIKSLFILGWIWEQYMNPEQAQNVYKKILEIAPRDGREYKIASGKIEYFIQEAKRLEDVRAKEEEILRMDSERYRRVQIANGKYTGYTKEQYLELGQKFLDDKNLPEAIIHLQGAVALMPDNPNAHYQYALVQMESAFQGNDNGFAIAKRELETVLSLDPEPLLKQKSEDLLKSLSKDTNPGTQP
ncbi:MAG: tetratricopeptide repeat protein [Candidatus Cloacimonetes bacterium]|nr:tetratricopeptide repeat protein [Candidatus Cloacimonadota bacterium]